MQAEVRVAVIQATPVMFNKPATVDKAITLTREAAAKGAHSSFPRVVHSLLSLVYELRAQSRKKPDNGP